MSSTPDPKSPATSRFARFSLRPPRFWVSLIFVAAGFAYLGFIRSFGMSIETGEGARTYYCLFDDAMISMRYARNLVDGHGLVWNPGGPAVEGYSNPLWVLWMVAIHLLPLDESKMSLPVMLSGIAILLAHLAVVWGIARTVARRALFGSLLALLFVAFYYPLAYWTLKGMEVGLFTLLTSGMAWIVLLLRRCPPSSRSTWLLTGLFALVVAILLLRPDGAVPVLVVGFFMVLWSPRSARWRRGILFAIAAAAPVVGLTLFRQAYYHDLLPNTYYLKLSNNPLSVRLGRGTMSLGRDLLRQLLWVVVPAVYYVCRTWKSRRAAGDAVFLSLLILSLCSYSIYVGGDAWETIGFPNRYLNAVLPLLFILAALGIDTALVRALRSSDGVERVLRMGILAVGLLILNRVYTMAQVEATGGGNPDVPRQVSFASAGILVLLGVGLIAFARALSRRIVLAKLPSVAVAFPRFRGSVPIRPPHLLLAVFALWWVPLNLSPVTEWINVGVPTQWAERLNIRLALLIRDTTREDAKIASGYAGALPYFDHRESVDLLGKCDPVVAKGYPAVSWFLPGHNKWNYTYSLGELRPDVSTSLMVPTPELLSYVTSLGYVEMPNGLLVLKGSPRILSDRIGEDYRTPATGAGSPSAAGETNVPVGATER